MIQVVFSPAHRQLRKQHLLGALLRVGDGTHQVDPAVFHHLQQVDPAVAHILIRPAGIGRNRLLVLVAVAAVLTMFAGDVVGVLVPPGADGLCLCIIRKS